jgi:hypothetical protein
MLKQRVITVIIALFFCSCNENDSKEKSQTFVTPIISTTPLVKPSKVFGAFFGNIKDADGINTPVIVTIADTTFVLTKYNKNVQQKSKLLTTLNGICQQDSGLIQLLVSKKVVNNFTILSADSIFCLTKKKMPSKGNDTNYLVKKH